MVAAKPSIAAFPRSSQITGESTTYDGLMARSLDMTAEPHLGLALGGGGVLGAAHVGVLQVLHERGIRPTVVAGTSAGAVIGASYAVGIDPYSLEDMVINADWHDFGRLSFAPGLGLLDTDALKENITRVAGKRAIEDLDVRFGAVATDLGTRDSVVLTEGSVADAVAASISVPGLFRPVKIDGRTLMDGGLTQNLPLEAAFDLGATHVIGVRLAEEWDGLEPFRTSAEVHALELGANVTMIRPRLDGHSQWHVDDLPALVLGGREATEKVLRDYPVVASQP